MASRLLTLPELGLLLYMLRGKPHVEHLLAVLPTAQVEDLTDGGVGSIRFVSTKLRRRLGSSIAELWYSDEDGVAVLASLYLDEEGELYELDSWKVDGSPLRRIPVF
ncbi:DUF6984 family protein [Hymenobacter mucosus]|uniref:DUF6984 domain-containing protein n=1 Tax=Hymenobacter mucosus TaxID=1411120 RepID=A0A238V2Y4_9BACT|nr:hypothetical protein [Hymenobacter mucosus]SNR28790.1 hypothetical protein SAMN06269173_10149 [Hymenobacter mucosus]